MIELSSVLTFRCSDVSLLAAFVGIDYSEINGSNYATRDRPTDSSHTQHAKISKAPEDTATERTEKPTRCRLTCLL